MRDLSNIKDAATANQAIRETKEAIAKGQKAIQDGSPASSPAIVRALEAELKALEDLKINNNWN